MSDSKAKSLNRKDPAPLVVPDRRTVATWNDIGDSFETLGKVGLALAVGFSAAGLFCRLAEQGKVKVPSLSSLVLNRGEQNASSEPRNTP